MSIRNNHNPLLDAVQSVIKLPTTEDYLLEGRVVDLSLLMEELGDRIIIPNRRICKSHVRSLKSSIMLHKQIMVPIIIKPVDKHYEVVDGIHRLAAYKQIITENPGIRILATIKRKQDQVKALALNNENK